MFDVALANWVGEPPSLCIHSETCGLALALEHTGDLYSCDHFVEPKLQARQHQASTACSTWSRRPSSASSASTSATRCRSYCLECDVRFACHGGCPKDRFITTPDGEPGLNYLCPGYKDFFHHVDRPMRFMTEQLAPRRCARRDHAALRGRGRTARPQRPLHLRLRPQVEALPRRGACAGGPVVSGEPPPYLARRRRTKGSGLL